MNEISFRESLDLADPLYVDVRSPSEYAHDHIPGAVNIPIFSDDERKEVGTLYRQAGRDEAVLRGTEYGGRKISSIVSAMSGYRGKDIVVYCARGGMRSSSVASLISSIGIPVYRLDRGYKGYRAHVLSELATCRGAGRLVVLQGLTGVGKTEIIRRLPCGIDLEKMAGHRSSLFGGMGLVQNTQKMFDSLLALRLREVAGLHYAVIEGESKKIGGVHMPEPLYAWIKDSPVILVEAPMERRIEVLITEYTASGGADAVPIVQSLRSKLGSKTVDDLVELFNRGNLHDFVELLLVRYYDPLYQYSLDRLHFIGTVENLDPDRAAEEVTDMADSFLF